MVVSMQRYVLGAVFAVIALAMPAATMSSPAADAEEVAPIVVDAADALTTGLNDQAAMVLLGTALIGLAGAVRRAA